MTSAPSSNGHRAPTLPSATRSWLVADGAGRERLLDMDERLRPVRRQTFAVLAAALVISVPWTGAWTLAPLLLAILLFRIADGEIKVAAHPEYWMFGAWAGAELIIAISIAVTGTTALYMLSLLAVPVVTLSARFSRAGIRAGVSIAFLLIVGVAFTADPSAVSANPPLLIAPIAVVIAAAMLSTAQMQSDIDHRDKAILDPLTNLLNRSALEARAMELEQLSAITKEPVGIVLLDLDHFKPINDTYGHSAGDGVLKEVAYTLRKGLRSYDYMYRIGGDEFLILVPGADVDDALQIGRTAREIISRVRFGLDKAQVTASCGISASNAGEEFNFKEIYKRADQALYAAKKGEGTAIDRIGAHGASR